jgi:hypothetical protein
MLKLLIKIILKVMVKNDQNLATKVMLKVEVKNRRKLTQK